MQQLKKQFQKMSSTRAGAGRDTHQAAEMS
jgi:hypothetical protein